VTGVQELYARYEGIITLFLRASPIVGGAVILAWRVRETRVPITRKAIVIPPVAMSTGFGMFMAPMMRVPVTWAIGALVLGAFVFALPLLYSTRLEPRDGVVYMSRSRAFLVILLVLLAVRLLLHDRVGRFVSPLQTAALFYLLAFGMIVRWRWRMYRQYQAIVAQLPASAA
jgi:membrane protein CcdC involved in cytochrome C biogenesis